MTTNEFEKMCELRGVEVKFCEATDTLSVDCPPRMVFTATGHHFRDVSMAGRTNADVYADIAEDIELGLELCRSDQTGSTADCGAFGCGGKIEAVD